MRRKASYRPKYGTSTLARQATHSFTSWISHPLLTRPYRQVVASKGDNSIQGLFSSGSRRHRPCFDNCRSRFFAYRTFTMATAEGPKKVTNSFLLWNLSQLAVSDGSERWSRSGSTTTAPAASTKKARKEGESRETTSTRTQHCQYSCRRTFLFTFGGCGRARRPASDSNSAVISTKAGYYRPSLLSLLILSPPSFSSPSSLSF